MPVVPIISGQRRAPRVALIHEWLVTMRGAERVLEVFGELFPEAPIFTLVHRKGSLSPALEQRAIHTSFLQRLPFATSHWRHYLPLMPFAIESFDFSRFDAVLSSSFCVVKGAVTRPDARHVCYCHTPMRYVWEQQAEYFGPDRAIPLVRLMAGGVTSWLRTWDEASARRPDTYLANSAHVARRIRKRYGAEATVVHPPVDCARFSPRAAAPAGGYYAMLTAFAPYKRVDLAVEAFTRLGRRLLIAGGGQDDRRIRALIKPGGPVELVGEIAGARVAEFLSGARAFVFPGEEDFGIAPVEAQACGVPVIAHGRGGALETVVDLEDAQHRPPTGVFFEEQSVEGLIAAVERFEAAEPDFSPAAARSNALRFDRPRFKATMKTVLAREFDWAPPAGTEGDRDTPVAV